MVYCMRNIIFCTILVLCLLQSCSALAHRQARQATGTEHPPGSGGNGGGHHQDNHNNTSDAHGGSDQQDDDVDVEDAAAVVGGAVGGAVAVLVVLALVVFCRRTAANKSDDQAADMMDTKTVSTVMSVPRSEVKAGRNSYSDVIVGKPNHNINKAFSFNETSTDTDKDKDDDVYATIDYMEHTYVELQDDPTIPGQYDMLEKRSIAANDGYEVPVLPLQDEHNVLY